MTQCCNKQFTYTGDREGTSHFCCPEHCCKQKTEERMTKETMCKTCGNLPCGDEKDCEWSGFTTETESVCHGHASKGKGCEVCKRPKCGLPTTDCFVDGSCPEKHCKGGENCYERGDPTLSTPFTSDGNKPSSSDKKKEGQDVVDRKNCSNCPHIDAHGIQYPCPPDTKVTIADTTVIAASTSPPESDWKKDFEKWWILFASNNFDLGTNHPDNVHYCKMAKEDVESFITDLLASERLCVIEECERVVRRYWPEEYHPRRDQAITALNKMKGDKWQVKENDMHDRDSFDISDVIREHQNVGRWKGEMKSDNKLKDV